MLFLHFLQIFSREYGVEYADHIVIEEKVNKLYTLRPPFTPNKFYERTTLNFKTFDHTKNENFFNVNVNTLFTLKENKINRVFYAIKNVKDETIELEGYENSLNIKAANAIFISKLGIKSGEIAITVRDYDILETASRIKDSFSAAGYIVKAVLPESLSIILHLIERNVDNIQKVAIINSRGRRSVLSVFDNEKYIDCIDRRIIGKGDYEIERKILEIFKKKILERFAAKIKFKDYKLVFYPQIIDDNFFDDNKLLKNYEHSSLEFPEIFDRVKNVLGIEYTKIKEFIKMSFDDIQKEMDKLKIQKEDEEIKKTVDELHNFILDKKKQRLKEEEEEIEELKKSMDDIELNSKEEEKKEEDKKEENKKEENKKEENKKEENKKEENIINDQNKKEENTINDENDVDEEKIDYASEVEYENTKNHLIDDKILVCDLTAAYKVMHNALVGQRGNFEDFDEIRIVNLNNRLQSSIFPITFDYKEVFNEVNTFISTLTFNTEHIKDLKEKGYRFLHVGDNLYKNHFESKGREILGSDKFFEDLTLTEFAIVQGPSRYLSTNLEINDSCVYIPEKSLKYNAFIKKNMNEFLNEHNILTIFEKNIIVISDAYNDKKNMFEYLPMETFTDLATEYIKAKADKSGYKFKEKLNNKFDGYTEENESIRIDTKKRPDGVKNLEKSLAKHKETSEIEDAKNLKKVYDEVKLWFEENKENKEVLFNAFNDKFKKLEGEALIYKRKKENEALMQKRKEEQERKAKEDAEKKEKEEQEKKAKEALEKKAEEMKLLEGDKIQSMPDHKTIEDKINEKIPLGEETAQPTFEKEMPKEIASEGVREDL
ncbi:hypothetical protein GVAV_000266 [Gurleya vavrai]